MDYQKNNYHGEPESWMKIIADKGDKCLGTIGTDAQGRPILIENLYQWTQKEWQHGVGQDNGWYIDEYLWFMAKPMIKIQDYYDEIPGPGMETLYGLVNGRYRTDSPSGKKDLTVDTPQFNIPTTVTDKHSDSIRIYAMITEMYPDTGLVTYRWEHPWDNIEGITQVNGDYIYFSSDSMVYKDIEYIDIVSTMNFENQEIFDNKTSEKIYQIQKPDTINQYQQYYLEVSTDNGDVLPMKYPTEIEFDENGLAEVGVSFKGVVNATSPWAPRIHNGYYYLNQHEYFAYSEFDVDANFDTYEESNYKVANGYVTIEVELVKPPNPREDYSISKMTRPELIQDENAFVWVKDKGVTLRPIIDGEYYKEYAVRQYVSPKITFDNVLTEAQPLTVHFSFDDTSMLDTYIPMEIRSYDHMESVWREWEPFTNGTVPTHLSNAYQLRFNLDAAVIHSDKFIEDYLCCYLDWKDDQNESTITNIVTITDYMTTGPADAPGTYVSRIFDYGCKSELSLDIYDSKYKDPVRLYIAYADDEESLLLENITWIEITGNNGNAKFTSRYFRYKFEIPANEKVYWLHKNLHTKESTVYLPYIEKITMDAAYQPEAECTDFVNVESFGIPKDGIYHEVFPSVLDIIEADVIAKGYELSHIQKVMLGCTTDGVYIEYNSAIDGMYPSASALDTPITAMSDVENSIMLKKTPFIKVDDKEVIPETRDFDYITITRGTPQQYCPITVEDEEGNVYKQIFEADDFMYLQDIYHMDVSEKYIELCRNDYEIETVQIFMNADDEPMDPALYKIVNHLLIFNDFLDAGTDITVTYRVVNTFKAIIDRAADTTTLVMYKDHIKCKELHDPANLRKYKVFFETGKRNNKFVAQDLSLNPIYRTDYKGFIYLTDDHNEPYKVNIYCNPLRLKAGGYDRVDIQIEVLDVQDNPIIAKPIAVDCQCGIITCEDYVTDMNGVVHLVYESSVLPATDTIKVRVETDHDTVIEQSICIINE
jgi:hypothetical protein